MKLNIKTILVAASVAITLGASAQNTKSGYFLDDYTYRYQMNPAFGNSRNFVAMPGLGNLSMGLNGTIGVKDVLYNVNGKTTTFLNPQVSAAEVMSNINDMNRLTGDLRETILGFGFKGLGGYTTFTVSARAGFGVKIPGSIFSFLKEGISNNTYQIANFKGYGNAYAEVALGHSHNITKDIRVGATLKVLVGAANAKLDLRKADLTLGTDDWSIQTDGDITVNMQGFKWKTEVSETTGKRYVNGVDVDDPSVGGMGFALDLGAVYKPSFLPDLEFSLAVLDLGFINWKNCMLATTNGLQSFNTDKYTFNVDDNAANSFDNEWDKIKKDAAALYELSNKGDQGSQSVALGATVNVGVLYSLPYYRNLKFGLLNTTHVQGEFSWTDFRVSANVMPCKIFDAGINLSAGTYGVGMGWLMNFHAPGFNLFVGMDRFASKLAKQGVPLSSNGQLNLGINFLF